MHADACVDELFAQALGEAPDSSLGRAVDAPITRIGVATSDTADVDDIARTAFRPLSKMGRTASVSR